MKQTLELAVINTNDDESELKFTYEGDVITIYLDDNQICSLDYASNFVFFLQEAIRRWGFAKEINE